MIGYIFKNAIEILKKKPFMLWGVSLLHAIIVIAVKATGSLLPLLTIPIVLTLDAGILSLYLDGYNGIEVNSKQLFKGFSKECISKVPAGMLWHQLWSLIWAFVPVVGIIKSYAYAFTPYILLSDKETSPLDALKLSMEKTYGYKARLFGLDLLMSLILIGVLLVFALISIIPFLGPIIGFVGVIATLVLFPLFKGLVMAGFYQEAISGKFEQPVYTYQQPQAPINNAPEAPAEGAWFCTQCGMQNSGNANFCTKCGNRRK